METTITDTLYRPLPPEKSEPAPHRKRWTRKECDFLAQNGILTGRYELINGDIIANLLPSDRSLKWQKEHSGVCAVHTENNTLL